MKKIKSVIAGITAAVVTLTSVFLGFTVIQATGEDALCYIDFGASYAASASAGEMWKYYQSGGDGKINLVNEQIEFAAETNANNTSGNRSVLLANNISDKKIESGGKYKIVFDVIATPDMFKNLSAQFIFANNNWGEIGGLSPVTDKLSAFTLEKQATEGSNTVYTLSKVIVAPTLGANCNLLLSIYGTGSGSKYYLDNVLIYAAKEYKLTLKNGAQIGSIYGVANSSIAPEIAGSAFDKIGYDFSVSPETYPVDTAEEIVIEYTPQENLSCYVDFGSDYAKSDPERYMPQNDTYVALEEQKARFKANDGTASFVQRAVLLSNDALASTVASGKKYRVTLQLISSDEITGHIVEMKFGADLGAVLSEPSALFDGAALQAGLQSKEARTDGTNLYTVHLDVTAPSEGGNVLVSVYGNKDCLLDVAVIRTFFTYQAEEVGGKSLGTITGFAGDSVADALVGSEFIREDYICTPFSSDTFPQKADEKVVLQYTEITNVLEYIDFGETYAAKHRSGGVPVWQYGGGSTSFITFGDREIVFDGLINSGKSYGDRAVLLTNDRTTTEIKAGRRYQLQFDLLLKNELPANKTVDIRFGDQVWDTASYLVAKASDLTLVNSEYKEPYTVYTLSVTLVAPASKNIVISIYGNGASGDSILKNVTIFEEFGYTCLDDNGDPAGTLYAFPGEDITDLIKDSEVDRHGYFESVDDPTAPAKQSGKITVHYTADPSFVSYIDFGPSYAATNENRYFVASGSMTRDKDAQCVRVPSNSKTVSDNFRNRSVVLANNYAESGLTVGQSYLVTFDLTVASDFNIAAFGIEFRSARYIGTGLDGSSRVYTGKELTEHIVSEKTVGANKVYTIALGYDLASSGWGSYAERNMLMSVFGGEKACSVDNVEISLASKVFLHNTDLPPLVGKIGYPLSMPSDLLKKGHIFTGWYADADMKIPFSQEKFANGDSQAYACFQAVDTETEMDFTAAPPAAAHLTGFTYDSVAGNIYAAAQNAGTAYLNLYKNAKAVQISPANDYPVTFRYKAEGYNGKIKVGLVSASEDSFTTAQNILATTVVTAGSEWSTGGLCATPDILTEGGKKGDFLYFFVEYEKSSGGKIYFDDIVLKQETTVSFDTMGGNAVADMSGEPGAAFALPEPKKTGAAFTGWYYDKALSKKVSGDQFSYPTATTRITLYASWNKTESVITDESFESYTDAEIENNANVSEKEVFSLSRGIAKTGNTSMRYRFDPATVSSLTPQRSTVKLKGNSGTSGSGITVEKSVVYVMSFYVYAKKLDASLDFTAFTASANNALKNGVQVTASVGNARISPKFFPKNEWKKVTYVFTPAQSVSDANELFLSVRTNSSSVFTEIYIDDVKVEPLGSDMGAVGFNTSVYSATLVDMEYNYTVGKVGDAVVFPQATRENYVLEGWYANYRYAEEFDPKFAAGAKAAFPQWDINGTVKVSLENASDYPQDGTGTGINRFTNHGGGKVVINQQASDGVAAYKYVGSDNRDWQKVLALKESDGSPLRLVDGNSYVILVDIFLESYGGDFGFNFCTASQDNYYAWNGSTTGSIIVNADTPKGVWITTALTINASFQQAGGFNLFLRHNAGSGNTAVYFDNFRISSIDPQKPIIIINKGLIAGSVDMISGKIGEKYTLPSDVKVKGYDFCGWYASPALTRPVDAEGVFFETMTVYAKMLPKEFQNDFETGSYGFSETKGGDMDYELYDKNDPGHTAANVHSGNKSLHRIGEDYQHKNALIVRKNATLYPGETYELSMWVKMDAYDHTNGAVKIASCSSSAFAWDLVGDMRAVVPIQDLTDGKWHHVTYQFMASAYYLALQTPGYCSIYFDDIVIKHLMTPGISDEPAFDEYIPVPKDANGKIPAIEEAAPEIITDPSLDVYEAYQKLLDQYNEYPDMEQTEEQVIEKKSASKQIRRVKRKKTTVTQKRNPLTFADILTCNSYVWYTVLFYAGAGMVLVAGTGITLLIIHKKKKRKTKPSGGKES